MPRKKKEETQKEFEQAAKTLHDNAKTFDEVYPEAKTTMIANLDSVLCTHQNLAEKNGVTYCVVCNQTI